MPKIVILLIAILFAFSFCSKKDSKDSKNQTSTEITTATESTESITETETTTQKSTIEEPTTESSTKESTTKTTTAESFTKESATEPIITELFTKVDWDNCIQTTQDYFSNNEFSEFIKDYIAIKVDNDTRVIKFYIVLHDGTEPQLAVELANSVVRYFNFAAQSQDDSIKESSEDYYGGLYDVYDFTIDVLTKSDMYDLDKWFVSSSVNRGMHTKQPIELQKSSNKSSSEFDWDKCMQYTKDEFLNNEFYTYIKDIAISVDRVDKIITFNAVVADSTSPEVALDLADSLIRHLNLSAQLQNGNIKSASKDYYGSIYDEFDIVINVSSESNIRNSSKWFIRDGVMRGMHTKQPIKLQKAYR